MSMQPDDQRCDRSRIDGRQLHELRYWSQKFGVTPMQLLDAVKHVGGRTERVQQYLMDAADPQAPASTTSLASIRRTRSSS